MPSYTNLWRSLLTIYDEREAQAIVRLVLETRFGLSLTDICCGKVEQLATDERRLLEQDMQRLLRGEPVQYVLGETEFCGRTFAVAKGVLIPRPETEELCQWIVATVGSNARVLDVGTGSGCIAVTLAKDIIGATVAAWDISTEALGIAKGNAERNGASVAFVLQDVLAAPNDVKRWTVVVSNPPYICEKERKDMRGNVVDYEPATALFVPDDKPLLFYEAVARYAIKALCDGGSLFFEINPLYAEELVTLLEDIGYTNIATRDDSYGKRRFLKAEKA